MEASQTLYFSQGTSRGDGLGIEGLMKPFARKTYTGSWKNDIDSKTCSCETITGMFQVSEEKKMKDILVTLSVDALIYYSSHIQGCSKYDDAITVLQWL